MNKYEVLMKYAETLIRQNLTLEYNRCLAGKAKAGDLLEVIDLQGKVTLQIRDGNTSHDKVIANAFLRSKEDEDVAETIDHLASEVYFEIRDEIIAELGGWPFPY